MDLTPGYDSSVKALLQKCTEEWAHPEDARKGLIPFGIKPLDQALYGIDPVNGDAILLQGAEKQRKTTAAINIVINYMTYDRLVVKPKTALFTLESGMQQTRYTSQTVANEATRLLIMQGHKPKEFCPACQAATCRELGLSPEFLRFNSRSPIQKKAIEEAVEIIATWPLRIFGANQKEGDSRNLGTSVKDKHSLWRRLIDDGTKIIVTDHIQQYAFSDEPTDYEKQLRAIAAISEVVAEYKIAVIILSQVSLTSQRDAAAGGKVYAAGGRRAAAEATSIISTSYEDGSGKLCLTLEDSRKAPKFSVWVDIDDTSGAQIPGREPVKGQKAAYMTQPKH